MSKDFENMGIYDLRNYARSMGVHSPTTLKRDELIFKINEIINGKQPEPKTTNKGRPPIHKNSDDFALDLILPDNLFQKSDDLKYKPFSNVEKKSTFQNILSEGQSSATDNILFKGFYKKSNNNYGFALLKGYATDYYKENTVILNSLATSYDLHDGDYIIGVARYVAEKEIMLATEINYINDISVSELSQRDIFENILPTYPNSVLELVGSLDFELINRVSPIAKGSRAIINFNCKNKVEYAKDLLNSFSQTNNLRTLLISIDDNPEDIGYITYNCPDVEVCTLTGRQTRQEYFEKVFMYISNCINRLEFGQEVSIVFYNASKFLKAYRDNLIISKNLTESAAEIMASNKIVDIFNLSRCKENSSLTVTLIDTNSKFLDIENCVINFNENCYKNTSIYYDIKSSLAMYLEKLLSVEKVKKARDFVHSFNELNAENEIKNFLSKN